MTEEKINLCLKLLQIKHSIEAKEIGKILFHEGDQNLRALVRKTQDSVKNVKILLMNLVMVGYVEVTSSPPHMIPVYSINGDNILRTLFYPRFIQITNKLYGLIPEILVEYLLEHGRMEYTLMIEKVTEALSESIFQATKADIEEKFKILVKTQLIERCPTLIHSQKPTPVFEDKIQNRFSLDNLPLLTEEGAEKPSKKRKLDPIYWKINFERFNQIMRDRDLVEIVHQNIDQPCSIVLAEMLSFAVTTTQPHAQQTVPIFYQKLKELMQKHDMQYNELDSCLSILTDSHMNIVTRLEPKSYAVNLMKGFEFLTTSTASSWVNDRLGAKSQKVFRLLLDEKKLDQNSIENKILMKSKETCKILYDMMSNDVVTVYPIGKDVHNMGSKNYHVFSVDMKLICSKMLEWLYVSLCNTYVKLEMVQEENSLLLSKEARVDIIIQKLKEQGTGADQLEREVNELILPDEKASLEKVKKMKDMLHSSLLLQADNLFTIEYWLLMKKNEALLS